jgi:hypothetical protein
VLSKMKYYFILVISIFGFDVKQMILPLARLPFDVSYC